MTKGDNMKIENIRPEDIEKKSFEIIQSILDEEGTKLEENLAPVIMRCIHTSADFEYAKSLYFSEGVIDKVRDAIKEGAYIVTDTRMAQAGINKKLIEGFGGKVLCFIGDEDVAKEAKERGVTRALVSMERAAKLDRPVIFAIGNAPTALLSIEKLYKEGRLDPVAVIGVPVGFVNVVESKERIIDSGVPCIVAKERKGGSNIAAAIVNAIQYQLR